MFGNDIEACARCGGKLEVIASITVPEQVQACCETEREGNVLLRDKSAGGVGACLLPGFPGQILSTQGTIGEVDGPSGADLIIIRPIHRHADHARAAEPQYAE